MGKHLKHPKIFSNNLHVKIKHRRREAKSKSMKKLIFKKLQTAPRCSHQRIFMNIEKAVGKQFLISLNI